MANSKVSIIIFVSILAVVVLIGAFLLASAKSSSTRISFVKGDGNMEDFEITEITRSITANVYENGSIRDEQSAAEMAAAIFKSVYGENFDDGLPLMVYFDDDEQNWLIKTQLPNNMLGGSKYIIIKKSTAEVVAIWGTK